MSQIKTSNIDTDSKRGLSEALQHVSKGWMPVSSQVLSLVQDRIRDGSYKGRYELLISDLKKDLGLFTFCLKEIGTVIDGPVQHRSPAEILTSLELEKIEKVLSSTKNIVGIHTVDPTQKPQLMRIRHSIISSATSEALAEKSKLDGTQAFVLSSVRQLGLNLIAWNYPRIYSKALISAAKGEGELEQLLLRLLGFSSLELGTRSALSWCAHGETCSVLGLGRESSEQIACQTANRYKTLCEAADTVAEIHDPEYFPESIKRWSKVSSQIEQVLGSNAFSVIQSKAEQYGASYASIHPAGFKIDFNPGKALKEAVTQLSEKLFEKNQYAQRCPTGLIEKFKALYRHIIPGKASPTAIKELVEDIIPALGFDKGCIYLIDQKKLQAVPMLRIGDVSIDRFRALNCSDAGAGTHPVVEALSYQAPIVQENAFINGAQVAHVTGVFGNQEKLGVLYLEMSRELRDGDRAHSLLFFKAAREALSDCLSMR